MARKGDASKVQEKDLIVVLEVEDGAQAIGAIQGAIREGGRSGHYFAASNGTGRAGSALCAAPEPRHHGTEDAKFERAIPIMNTTTLLGAVQGIST